MSRQQKLKRILSVVRSEDKIAELKELLTMVNDGLSKEEFKALTKQLIKLILDIEKKLTKRVDSKTDGKNEEFMELMASFSQIIDKTEKENYNIFSGVQQRVTNLFTGFFTKNEINGKLKELDIRIAELNRLIDDNKIDTEKLSGDILSKVPDGSTDIESLRTDLEKYKKLKGGGTSALGIRQAFKWILKTETPTGLIDGANTTYTVSTTIYAVLAFSLNGEVMCQLPNYTISGKTITFLTAIPAAYSGKDFEIKFV